MTILAKPATELKTPRLHRFTADEYLEMNRLGFFQGKRVELIDGEILDMAAQEVPHRRAVTRCFWLSRNAYADTAKYFVVSQGTLKLRGDMPEPDLYVLPCAEQTPESEFPLPLWVLEISEHTHRFDTGRKLAMYARHGIAEYLVLDLKRRQLEVYREPIQSPEQWSYRSRQILLEGDVWKPADGPAVEFSVAAMLP